MGTMRELTPRAAAWADTMGGHPDSQLVRAHADSTAGVALSAPVGRRQREETEDRLLGPEAARARGAAAADARMAAGEDTPMLGVPIALKDVLVTRGLRTTAGSRILENYVPVWEGTAVARLRAAGAH